ncbi:MAG: DUF2283 domain-containing protein [Gemmatimonadaceae bacterium]
MTYSPEADAFALDFHPVPAGRRVTRELAPNVRADYIGDRLVGFEILDASTLIPSEALATIGAPSFPVLTIAEAAKKFKRHPRTLRYAAERGKIAGAEKTGRDWLVPYVGVLNYVVNLPPAGRPAKHRRAPNRRRRAKVSEA